MPTDLVEKLMLLFAFCASSVLFQWLLERRESARLRKQTQVILLSDPASLASLYDARELCIHPNHDHSVNKNVRRVKESNRNLLKLYLKAIKTSPDDEPLPLNLLQEVARLHYCNNHIRNLKVQLISAFVTKWQNELLDRATALSLSNTMVLDINRILTIPGSFPSMLLDIDEAGINDLEGEELSTLASQHSKPIIVIAEQADIGSPERELPSTPKPNQPRITPPPSLSPGTRPRRPSTISEPKPWRLERMPDLSPDALHRAIFDVLSERERRDGKIYVLRREGFDSFFKVGYTTQPDVEDRAEQIRSQCDVHYDIVGFWVAPNAERVEKLIHTDYQVRYRRFQDPCWVNRGQRSRCAKTHDEIIEDDLEAVKRCVKHWVDWMTLCGPNAEPIITPYHKESGELKPGWVRHAFKPDAEAACEDCDSRFCFTSQGDSWVYRDGTKPPDPPLVPYPRSVTVTPSPTPTPTRSPTPSLGVSSGTGQRSTKLSTKKQRAVSMPSSGSADVQPVIQAARPPLQPSIATDPLPASPSGSPTPPPTRRRGRKSAATPDVAAQEYWECRACTLHNALPRRDCEACGGTRSEQVDSAPASHNAPDSVPEVAKTLRFPKVDHPSAVLEIPCYRPHDPSRGREEAGVKAENEEGR